MELRLIEVVLPERNLEALEKLLDGRGEVLDVMLLRSLGSYRYPVLGVWRERFSTEEIIVRILASAEKTEALTDLISDRFSNEDGFRINIIPVMATIPGMPERAEPSHTEVSPEDNKVSKERISREELYSSLETAAKLTKVYIAMIVLSSIIAAAGLLSNNVVLIIGAMVVAPLMGPNVALALATTLGDLTLARNALRTDLVGISLAIILSVLLGFVLPVDPSMPEIRSRTSVGLAEVIVAFASGCAGVLAFTTAAPAVIIGVAVAVSLLPPLVAFGLLLGAGYVSHATGALLLFLVNLISVNLAGVATFIAQGILPRNWWEADRARRATSIAIVLWVLLLAALLMILAFRI
ncbi:MAG: TIGR00341 family protein [Methanothrix sp.]|jgi:uncharacterized hydrophobic protein (TIGR00341 family)|uniref:TIGR00341 family protein n=1 Tax=Methanothrix sp. TaxID=90426 RepID=UPI00247D0C18|nr:TIGR00341 family protein [Methanothrix sp.]